MLFLITDGLEANNAIMTIMSDVYYVVLVLLPRSTKLKL